MATESQVILDPALMRKNVLLRGLSGADAAAVADTGKLVFLKTRSL